jgi:hypothetical protein
VPSTGRLALTYVLPLRFSEPDVPGIRDELTSYLAKLAEWCDDVVVVDGSPAALFDENDRLWAGLVRHVPPDPAHRALMGKVPGVLTGVDEARHDMIVIADDDVRYGRAELARMLDLLDDHDLVRPQNYFEPLPWHARWDTARTLLNRATGRDFPGTLGVRQTLLQRTGGYDGDVLFENLELIRTVEAAGGRVTSPLDLYVRRLPPTTAHFLGQRTRQAYDDFAVPARMIVWLLVAPLIALSQRRRLALAGVAVVSMTTAEAGRRRASGADLFPATASLLAPAWVLERSICAWLAVAQRLRFGGVRYGDSVIKVAANSERTLRRRLRPPG